MSRIRTGRAPSLTLPTQPGPTNHISEHTPIHRPHLQRPAKHIHVPARRRHGRPARRDPPEALLVVVGRRCLGVAAAGCCLVVRMRVSLIWMGHTDCSAPKTRPTPPNSLTGLRLSLRLLLLLLSPPLRRVRKQGPDRVVLTATVPLLLLRRRRHQHRRGAAPLPEGGGRGCRRCGRRGRPPEVSEGERCISVCGIEG